MARITLSRDQLRVRSATERSLTAALGGHVAQCDQCPFQRICLYADVTHIVRNASSQPAPNGSRTVKPSSSMNVQLHIHRVELNRYAV